MGRKYGKGQKSMGIWGLYDVCDLSREDWKSLAQRVQLQDCFFASLSDSGAGLLRARLPGVLIQVLYVAPPCAMTSHSIADRIQKGTLQTQAFPEQGFQENQMEAAWPFLI